MTPKVVHVISLIFLWNCSTHAMLGDVLSDYAVEQMAPYLLTTEDLGMACETGVSMGGFLLSFKRVTDTPNEAAIFTLLAAAHCAEAEAWEVELTGLRAARKGQAEESQDARIREKRAHAVAARRYYRAYKHLQSFLTDPIHECAQYASRQDQLAGVFGLMSVVLGVQHDRASGGQVGIPLDEPAKAARALACLPNTTWWGIPNALQAAIYTGVPGSAPEGIDPWAQLEQAAALGDKQGLVVARAIQAQAAAAAGKLPLMRESISRLVQARQRHDAPPALKLLNVIAHRQVEALSDRLWTELTGHRTPNGALGTFWDIKEPESDEEDSLLDDLSFLNLSRHKN
jgi:hypothetical protein